MDKRFYLGIPREDLDWFPTIDEKKCTGCKECINTCPNNVFDYDEIGNLSKVINPYNCVVLCDKCALFCPTEALTFPDKEQFKAHLREIVLKKRGKR